MLQGEFLLQRVELARGETVWFLAVILMPHGSDHLIVLLVALLELLLAILELHLQELQLLVLDGSLFLEIVVLLLQLLLRFPQLGLQLSHLTAHLLEPAVLLPRMHGKFTLILLAKCRHCELHLPGLVLGLADHCLVLCFLLSPELRFLLELQLLIFKL